MRGHQYLVTLVGKRSPLKCPENKKVPSKEFKLALKRGFVPKIVAFSSG